MHVNRIEAVLLDMGGVLIPEVGGYEATARNADLLAILRSEGISDPEAFVRGRARAVRQAYRELKTSCTQPDLDEVLAEDSPHLRKLLLHAFRRQATQPAYVHARHTVATLARTYRLGLVSNTVIPGRHHELALRRAGLLQYIECSVWSANFGVRKPDPAMIRHVLEELRVPARRAIFVGDKLRTDVLAARRAGVRSVYLRKRGAPRQGKVRPDFTIQDFRALPMLLRQLR